MLFPWGLERPTVPAIVEAAKLAEDLGFYSVTLPTHMTLPPGWLFETDQNQSKRGSTSATRNGRYSLTMLVRNSIQLRSASF